MASLQRKGDCFYCQFLYAHKRRTLTVGKVSLAEARQWKSRAENLLMRLKQRLLELPVGCDIVDFIQHDGKPPVAADESTNTTLHQLREAYLGVFSNGAIAKNTIATVRVHLTHLEATHGETFMLRNLSLAALQKHVTRRQEAVTGITIKKEMDTFRAVWNWGQRMNLVNGIFPCKGLVYPKADEKFPFMSWEEIERRIRAGGAARRRSEPFEFR